MNTRYHARVPPKNDYVEKLVRSGKEIELFDLIKYGPEIIAWQEWMAGLKGFIDEQKNTPTAL